MHSPESTQAFAHLRAASVPSPRRKMSSTPAITARGSALTPPASVTRVDSADSKVKAGWSLMSRTLEPFQGQLIAIQAALSRQNSAAGTLAHERLDDLDG